MNRRCKVGLIEAGRHKGRLRDRENVIALKSSSILLIHRKGDRIWTWRKDRYTEITLALR